MQFPEFREWIIREKLTMKAKKEEPKKTLIERLMRSKTWNFIQIVAPLLAIMVPIAIYLISQQFGQITIRGVQKTVLIDPRKRISDGVTMSYKHAPIANLAKYVLKIENTGNRDIDGSDIDHLQWLPPKGSEILNAEIIDETSGYGNFISLDQSRKNILKINIIALNKNVWATIGILCSSNSLWTIDSGCKIEGVVKGASIVDESMKFVEKKPSFVQNIFAGGIWTNLAKPIIFLIMLVVLIALFIAPIAGISRYIQKRKRTKLLEPIKHDLDDFLATHDISNTCRDYVAESLEYFSKLNVPQLK